MEPANRQAGLPRGPGTQPPAGDPFAAAGESPALRQAADTQLAAPSPKPIQLAACREMCPSGLTLYHGQTDDPLQIVQHVGQAAAWHLLLTRTTLSPPLSIELETNAFLWNWYPLEILQRVSPVLLAPADHPDLARIVREAWGQDSLVWIFSDTKTPDLLQQLTAAVRGDDGTSTAPPQRVLGFNLPSAARPMFKQLGLAAAAPLDAAVQGMLMETEEPGGWQLYCSDKLDQALSVTTRTA